MQYVSGLIYLEETFKKGYIGFENGLIKEIGKSTNKETLAKGIIIPAFTNTHTHIGDSCAKIEPLGDLKSVVGTRGLKYNILKSEKNKNIIESIKRELNNMLFSGCGEFCDFREGGLRGIKILKEAVKNSPTSAKVLGRPENLEYNSEEIDRILNISEGIGVSSISDWDYYELKKISSHTIKRNKIFALHASERIRENINKIIELKPTFLVHMLEATDKDILECVENDIPIVVCPRANLHFEKLPNIPKLLSLGATVALGTDNAMLNTTSILTELEFAYKISRLFVKYKSVTAKDILNLAYTGRKILNPKEDIYIREDGKAYFIVFALPLDCKNPEYFIVCRSTQTTISLISAGDFLWRRHE